MITQAIISFILSPIILLLNFMDDYSINLTLPQGFMNYASNFLGGLGYVLPIAGLLPIFTLKISIYVFKIIVAFVCRVKSFIPTMGA